MVNVLKQDVVQELANALMVNVVVDTDIVEQHQNSVPFLMVVKKNMVIVKKKINSYRNKKKVVLVTKTVKIELKIVILLYDYCLILLFYFI